MRFPYLTILGCIILLSLVYFKNKPKTIDASSLSTVRPGQYLVQGDVHAVEKKRDTLCVIVRDNSGLSPQLCANKKLNLLTDSTAIYTINKQGQYYSVVEQVVTENIVRENLLITTGRVKRENIRTVEAIRDGKLIWIEVSGSLEGLKPGAKLITRSNGITEVYAP